MGEGREKAGERDKSNANVEPQSRIGGRGTWRRAAGC